MIYLKFVLNNLTFTPSGAILRFYILPNDDCGLVIEHHIVHETTDNSWHEDTITWNNKPAYDPTNLGETSVGNLVVDTNFDIPVSAAAIHTGTMSLVVENTWLCHQTFASRETANPPLLIINP